MNTTRGDGKQQAVAAGNNAAALGIFISTEQLNCYSGSRKLRFIPPFTGLLSQLTHFSLQMPTTIFGLGRSPNFVDKIAVGLSPVLNLTAGMEHSKVMPRRANFALVVRRLEIKGSWMKLKGL